jgi:hypothetical protein
MPRHVRLAFLAIVLIAATVAVWILGGFLWPRPQFENRGAPWVGDSAGEGR